VKERKESLNESVSESKVQPQVQPPASGEKVAIPQVFTPQENGHSEAHNTNKTES